MCHKTGPGACDVSFVFDSRDHLPGHSYTYKSPAKREAAAAAVDLSNTTFLALEDQIEGLDEIRVGSLTCTLNQPVNHSIKSSLNDLRSCWQLANGQSKYDSGI